MKFIRLRNSIGIDYMKEHLVAEESNLEDFMNGLKAMLVEEPENIFITQAWEGDKLKAFLISLNMIKRNYVWLDQVWSDLDNPPDVNDKIFFRFLMWVDSLGKKEIRIETKRDEDAIARRWKFEKYSAIMKFEIKDDYEKEFMKGMRKEDDDKQKDIPIIGITSEKVEENKNG